MARLYSGTFPSTGQDTKVVFTNVRGATATLDLGAAAASSPSVDLIPATTATVFGVAMILWLIVSGALKTRRASIHE